MGNEYAKQRWREVDILIIDEISMMAATFLDKLNFIAQRARNDRRPFGGVQLVVCGDFFQLVRLLCCFDRIDVKNIVCIEFVVSNPISASSRIGKGWICI